MQTFHFWKLFDYHSYFSTWSVYHISLTYSFFLLDTLPPRFSIFLTLLFIFVLSHPFLHHFPFFLIPFFLLHVTTFIFFSSLSSFTYTSCCISPFPLFLPLSSPHPLSPPPRFLLLPLLLLFFSLAVLVASVHLALSRQLGHSVLRRMKKADKLPTEKCCIRVAPWCMAHLGSEGPGEPRTHWLRGLSCSESNEWCVCKCCNVLFVWLYVYVCVCLYVCICYFFH